MRHLSLIVLSASRLRKLAYSLTLASFSLVSVSMLSGCDSAGSTDKSKQLQEMGAFQFPQALEITDVPFIDEDQQTFTKENFKGKWSLVFFGYTFCPDVCPTTLYTLKQAWKKMPKELTDSTQVVMVSVDPERDTPEVLKPYIEYFHPDYKGVTGNKASLESLAAELNAIYARVEREDNLGYLMDHSANIVVLDDQGNYAGFIKPPITISRIADAYQLIRSPIQ